MSERDMGFRHSEKRNKGCPRSAPPRSFPSVGVVLEGGLRFAVYSGGRRRSGGARGHGRAHQLLGKIGNSLEVEGVEELEGEDDGLQPNLPVGTGEDPGAAGDGEVGGVVGEVGALHGKMPVVPEIEAVDGLVLVAVLLRQVLHQDADPRRNPSPLLQVPEI